MQAEPLSSCRLLFVLISVVVRSHLFVDAGLLMLEEIKTRTSKHLVAIARVLFLNRCSLLERAARPSASTVRLLLLLRLFQCPSLLMAQVATVLLVPPRVSRESRTTASFEGFISTFFRLTGILESSSVFVPAVGIVAFCFGLVLEIMPRANAVRAKS